MYSWMCVMSVMMERRKKKDEQKNNEKKRTKRKRKHFTSVSRWIWSNFTLWLRPRAYADVYWGNLEAHFTDTNLDLFPVNTCAVGKETKSSQVSRQVNWPVTYWVLRVFVVSMFIPVAPLCVPHHRTKSDFKLNWGTSDDQLKKANRVARTYFLSLSLSLFCFSCVLVASMISSHSAYSFDRKFSLLLTLQVDSSAFARGHAHSPLGDGMNDVKDASFTLSLIHSLTHSSSLRCKVHTYTYIQLHTHTRFNFSLMQPSKSKLKIRAVLDSVVFLESLLEFNLTTES